jgi:hypothetical protein
MYVFPRKFSRTIARETQIPDHHDAPVGERDNHPRPAPAGPSAGNGLQGLARVARAWHPEAATRRLRERGGLGGCTTSELKTLGCLLVWRRAVDGTR